jgi:hypothetical protein
METSRQTDSLTFYIIFLASVSIPYLADSYMPLCQRGYVHVVVACVAILMLIDTSFDVSKNKQQVHATKLLRAGWLMHALGQVSAAIYWFHP